MQVRDVAVADVDLPPIEHIAVAVAHRGRRHAQDVATGLRLGHSDGRQHVAARDGGQPSHLLRLAAEVHDLGDPQLRRLDHGAHGAADPGQFFDDDGLRDVPQAQAAVLAVDGHADPALPCDQRR